MNQFIRCIEKSREWLRVSGPDAQRFLNGMWTCDVKRAVQQEMGVFSSGLGYILTNKGKPISEAVFLCEDEQNYLFSIPTGWGQKVYEALDRYLVADKVELKLESSSPYHVIIAQNSNLRPEASKLEIPATLPGSNDKIFKVESHSWGLRVPRAQMGNAHEEWWIRSGQKPPLPAEAFKILSTPEWDGLRIESGTLEWGVDFHEEHLPVEFPVGSAVSFTKGCYIGQEVVARATYRGHINKAFSRFQAEGTLSVGEVFAEVDETRPVARLTTAYQNKGLGIVRLSAVHTGAALFQKTPQGGKVRITKVEELVDKLVS